MVLHSLPVAPFTHAFPRSLSCGIETQDACFRIDSLRRCRCCCLAIPRTLSISFCSQDLCYAARLAVVFHIFFQLALFNSTFRSLARSIQGCFFCTFISLGPFVSSAVLFLDLSFLFFFTPYPSLTSSSLDRSVYLFSLFILSSEARLTVYGNCCTVWSGSYKAPAARLLSDGRAWRVGGRARCYFNRESGKEIWHLDKKNWTTDDEYWRSWTHTKTVRRTDEFTYCVCL